MQLCCICKISLLFLPINFYDLKKIKYLNNSTDFYGIITASLCLLHCISTPLIIISSSYLISEFSMLHTFWKGLDYVFISISFFLVYFSAQFTKLKMMKFLFWGSWFILFVLIINEKTEYIQLSEYLTYLAASILSLLHFYNLKYLK